MGVLSPAGEGKPVDKAGASVYGWRKCLLHKALYGGADEMGRRGDRGPNGDKTGCKGVAEGAWAGAGPFIHRRRGQGCE